MPTDIQALPAELIGYVFELIDDDKDQLSFREVSRSLEAISFYSFSRKYFNHVSVTLTRLGLQRLLSIANDKRLAPRVRSISVNLAVLSDKWSEEFDIGFGLNVYPYDTVHSAAYEKHVAQQFLLLTNEIGSTVYAAFVRAFRSFSNCGEVSLEFDICARDFRAVKALNEDTFWARMIGDEMISDKIFNLIFLAIGESQARSVAKFHIRTPEGEHPQWGHDARRYVSLGGNAFKCPLTQSSHFESGFENLTDMSLEIFPPQRVEPHRNSWTPAAYSSFARILASAKALQCLNLSAESWAPGAEAEFLAHLVEPMELHKPHLKKLTLSFDGGFCNGPQILPEILLEFLHVFRDTLTDLRIEGVVLLGSWDTVLISLRDELQLTHLDITECVTDGFDDEIDGKLVFAYRYGNKEPASKEDVARLVYSGSQMTEWLDLATKQLAYFHITEMDRLGFFSKEVSDRLPPLEL